MPPAVEGTAGLAGSWKPTGGLVWTAWRLLPDLPGTFPASLSLEPRCRPPAGITNMQSAKGLYQVGATGLEPVTPPRVKLFGASPPTSTDVRSHLPDWACGE